ncbi:hypothetical protein FISHEDRAFT_66228 [Fistulina hepatica ATCC 64428]|uniref:Uncharacterized protein n=1 Tax=Fistulina hepatica ATCC 64428 TaxID=1128425 RepID=A0A0D7A8D7_9AGAR|nr:hypothetical protein FISHEDRAFT_66228 [Fistulina hepatica ATCC 64428]
MSGPSSRPPAKPPSSIPSTPFRSECAPSLSSNRFVSSRQRKFSDASASQSLYPSSVRQVYSRHAARSGPSQLSSSRRTDTPSSATVSSPLTPYDWHEGASSIDVDVAEDKMLPTSFITSLLKEKSSPRHPDSTISTDGFSGFSDMTYPPVSRYPQTIPEDVVAERVLPLPATSRSEARSTRSSLDDSATLYSNVDPTTIITTASISRMGAQQGSVVGVAPATIHSISQRTRSPATASTRSGTSYVTSILSHSRDNIRQFYYRMTNKHLPPVPNVPIAPERDVKQKMQEELMPLPELVGRATTLRTLLEKGEYPYRSISSADRSKYEGIHDPPVSPYSLSPAMTPVRVGGFDTGRLAGPPHERLNSSEHGAPSAPTSMSRRKKIIITSVFVFLVVAIAVGVGVGVGLGRKKSDTTHNCDGNYTGTSCTLDATCVCTSSSSTCNGLARSILDLISPVNELFNANFSNSSVYESIWLVQGSSSDGVCTEQALAVDVAKGLDVTTAPNRTTWAQAAILWNLVLALDSSNKLKSFVNSAPWSSLDSTDGPTTDETGSFSITENGYTFDFAAQNVTAPNVSFATNGQPTSSQIEQADDVATAALDRMYSYAVASATQRQAALTSYWTSTLNQDASDLDTFVSAFSGAPILLPFDAESTSVASQLTNTSSNPWPPPLACYPNLTDSQVHIVNSFEESFFGLPSFTAASSFNSDCYPNRPIYGVLDIFRLRLPFVDSRKGLAKQSASLATATRPRAIIYSGERLSAYPQVQPQTLTRLEMDPRQAGTTNHIYHVIMDFFESISDVSLAGDVADYIVGSTSVPPTNASNANLLASLSSLPVVEVAVFGSVDTSDLDAAQSSFTMANGSLFFGTDQGERVRDWAISGSLTLAWTENATASEVVYDSSYTDTTFNEVWKAAHTAVTHNVTSVTVNDVVTSFEETDEFSP